MEAIKATVSGINQPAKKRTSACGQQARFRRHSMDFSNWYFLTGLVVRYQRELKMHQAFFHLACLYDNSK